MSNQPKPKPTTKPKAAAKGRTGKQSLTYQQRVFVAEYLKDRNGTQAAIRSGYSAHTAAEQAKRLLRNAQIQASIESFVIKAEEKAGLTVERTLREVARLAYFDPRRLLNADGSPKPINELDDDTAACLAGMDILEQFEGSGDQRAFVGYVKKYKIADKNAALEKAMKHLGLYEKDNEQKPEVNVTTRVVLVPSKEKAEVFTKSMKTGD
jgi:phage terminase small subunit